MNLYLIAALIGLAVLFLVITVTWIKAIHDQMRDDAQEGFSDER